MHFARRKTDLTHVWIRRFIADETHVSICHHIIEVSPTLRSHVKMNIRRRFILGGQCLCIPVLRPSAEKKGDSSYVQETIKEVFGKCPSLDGSRVQNQQL